MSYEASGTVLWINKTQEFASGFKKREFAITTWEDKYPQTLKFEFVKESCSKLDNVEEGDGLKVFFNLRGNDYQGKIYINLVAWAIKEDNTQGTPEQMPGTLKEAALPPPPVLAEDEESDVPF